MLKSSQSGFTLVELLLAMAMFSFGLLVIVAGFLAILGFYQHGTATRVVQNAARTGINEMVLFGRSAQWFAYNDSTPGMVCVANANAGSKIFYVYVNGSTRQLREAVWDQTNGCTASAVKAGTDVAITSSDVQVAALTPEQIDNFNGTATTPCTTAAQCPDHLTSLRINLGVTSDYNHLDASHTSCLPSAGPFCTVSTLSTTMSAGAQ